MSDRGVHRTGHGHDTAAFLGQVPLFAALPEHTRRELAEAASWQHLGGGSYLFHQGDAADALALVWSGRLQVIDEAEHEVIGVLGHGGWVGELSLLTGAPRAAGVRAL